MIEKVTVKEVEYKFEPVSKTVDEIITGIAKYLYATDLDVPQALARAEVLLKGTGCSEDEINLIVPAALGRMTAWMRTPCKDG